MDKPRHIAIFVPTLHGGGAERVMVTLANGFAEMGHRVDLVLTKAEGPYLGEVSDQVRIVDLKRSRVLTSLLPLARYLRRDRPDAMLSALRHANVVAILARILARGRMRLVISERNSLTVHDEGRFLQAAMRIAYPFSDHVIAVSKGIASQLVLQFGLKEEHVSAIPNPVDMAVISELAHERPRHPWLAPGSPPLILAVGRLSPQKDFHTLLEAFASLRRRLDLRLIILGEGELREDLELKISELDVKGSVQLVGFQPNPYGWMAACQAYVMSSRYEGFPNSLVQAMACGAPVVSTDCPTGPAEILQGGKWGRLVPIGDANALADSLAAALIDSRPPDVRARARDFRSQLIIAEYARHLECDLRVACLQASQ